MTMLKQLWTVSLFGLTLAAGCASEDDLVLAGSEDPVIEVDAPEAALVSTAPATDVEAAPVAATAASTNCLVVEYCNAPESRWPGIGTLCKRRSGETCNYTQEKAECVADAKYVCGGVTYPYAIYNN